MFVPLLSLKNPQCPHSSPHEFWERKEKESQRQRRDSETEAEGSSYLDVPKRGLLEQHVLLGAVSRDQNRVVRLVRVAGAEEGGDDSKYVELQGPRINGDGNRSVVVELRCHLCLVQTRGELSPPHDLGHKFGRVELGLAGVLGIARVGPPTGRWAADRFVVPVRSTGAASKVANAVGVIFIAHDAALPDQVVKRVLGRGELGQKRGDADEAGGRSLTDGYPPLGPQSPVSF